MPRKPPKARKGRAAAAAAPTPEPETAPTPKPVAAPEPPAVDRKAILAAARAAKAALKEVATTENAFAAIRHKEEMAALREKVEAAEKVKHVATIRKDLRAASRAAGSDRGQQPPRAPSRHRAPTYTFA
jgi:predicted component of type VI protein secretion system